MLPAFSADGVREHLKRERNVMRCVVALLALFAASLSTSHAGAQDALKYGSAVKLVAVYYLPVLAAQEQGFFKQNGLDVEYFPSQSGTDMQRALAASAIKIGSSGAGSDILSAARGVPVVIVANLQSYDDFAIYVASNGRTQKPQDLKGAKIGVSRFGGLEHAYGQLVAQQLGLGSDIQFVSTGGINESLALLTTGGIDAVVHIPDTTMNLVLEGHIKPLLRVRDYLPKSWAASTIVARKDFVEKETDTARRVVQSILEANRFIMSPAAKPWVIAKMQQMNNYTPEAANIIYSSLALSPDGTMPQDAIKNLTDFMVAHGLIKAAEAPSLDQMYTDRLLH
jgi:NitT/TauT family transport system substrate-binding protein